MGAPSQREPRPKAAGRPFLRRRLVAAAAVAGALTALVLIVVLVGSRGPDEEAAVRRYAAAWRGGDWAAMRAQLTDNARARISTESLRDRFAAAASTATARVVTPGDPVRRGKGRWGLPVTVKTRVFGLVRGVIELTVVTEQGAARIGWRPRQVFPGLADGEQLRATTRMPERGDLLARDGTLLAGGQDRRTALPDAAADAIVGALGPQPAPAREGWRRMGLPADAQVGVSGLERIFERRLQGLPGGELRAGLRLIARTEPRKAPPVRTSIAPKVQAAAVEALAGRYGGIIAMRPGSGQVLAAAGIGFSGLQPPGSTFKIITLTSALEAGVAKPATTYPVRTAAILEGVELQNANGEACGGTLTASFAASCNSVFAPLGVRVGARRLVQTAERFGFNKDPGIQGAAVSTIPPAGQIGDDLALGSTAIGQGLVQATALQMATVAASIALGGRRPQATFDADGPDRAPAVRVTDAATAATVRRMMEGVVTGGTGVAARIPGTAVAGKTGTAELKTTQPCRTTGAQDPATTGGEPAVANPESCADDGGADPTDTDAWFSAFAPAGNRTPRVAVGVLLVGAGAGGDTAAPAARQVILAALGR